MSVIVSGIDASVIFFLLIALNGFFCYVKIPILALPCAGVSIIYLLGFNIDYSGLNLILTFILIIFLIGSTVLNYKDYKK
jgi:hypothetical protein